MADKPLQNELEEQVLAMLFPPLKRYEVGIENLDSRIKWQPIERFLCE